MARTVLVLALLAALAPASPRSAGAAGTDLGAAVTRPDTSRFLPSWLHATLEAGVLWMQSPREVSDRYSAGVAFGGGLSASAGTRVRWSARLAYLDLPNGSGGYVGQYQSQGGQVVASPYGGYNAFGGGHALEGLAVASVRAWRDAWLEAGAGHGYFSSGYPNVQFIDGATGEPVEIPGQSGWGPAYTAGLRYEFVVRGREKLFLSARWARLERGGVSLDFVPLGIGYRFD